MSLNLALNLKCYLFLIYCIIFTFFRWALQRGVAIIPKSTSRERIHSNFNLCFELSDSDMKALDSLEKNEKFSWEPSVVK